MVGDTKIMSPRNDAGTAVVARRHAQLGARTCRLLLQTAGAISADWAACQAAPQVVKPGGGRVSAERTG